MQNYSSFSDSELVLLHQKGDPRAFVVIYERYWPLLFRHASKMLNDDEEVRDVLQEVFSTVWDQLLHLEIRISLSSYLYSLVRNRILNTIARLKVKARYVQSLSDFIEQSHVMADHLVREKQFSKLIEQEIAQLPEKMREIFYLSRKENLSYKEIAVKLTISENTVKKQVSNALKQLRFKLGSFFIILVFLFN